MNSSYTKTEKKIINATLKTLYENGPASTNTLKIAENAEVSEVTIFRRFKSKDNLLEVTKNYYLDYVLCEIDNVFKYDDNKEFEVLLKEIGESILDFFEKNLMIFKVAIEGAFSKKNTHVISMVSDKIINKIETIFENAIKNNQIREINTKVAAFNVYSVIFQSISLWRIHDGKPLVDFDKKLDEFLDIFLNGVRNLD